MGRTLLEGQHRIAVVDVSVDKLHHHVEGEYGGEDNIERQGALDSVRHFYWYGDGGVRDGDGYQKVERRHPPAARMDHQAVEAFGPLQQDQALVGVRLPCTPPHKQRGARRCSADTLATPCCQRVQRAPEASNLRLAVSHRPPSVASHRLMRFSHPATLPTSRNTVPANGRARGGGGRNSLRVDLGVPGKNCSDLFPNLHQPTRTDPRCTPYMDME